MMNLFGVLTIGILIGQCQDAYCFSDGSKLAKGFSATRSVFCHRSTNKRQPLHFNSQCNGYCEPNRKGELYYSMEVSAPTYWLDLITIDITAKDISDRSVTGFSIYAVDETQMVAGSFVEDDNHILVGSCGDILAYNQETHGAFHKLADHDRKNITLKFQPDGFNHGEIRFIAWIVNNHSDIHYMESLPLTPDKNGTNGLDIPTVLRDMVSDVDIKSFEKSFEYRKKLGYRLDLENPFALFDSTPDAVALVPLNMTISARAAHNEAKTMGDYSTVAPAGTVPGTVPETSSPGGSLQAPDVTVPNVFQDKPLADAGVASHDYQQLFSESHNVDVNVTGNSYVGSNTGNDHPNSAGSTHDGNYDNPNSVGSTNVGNYNPNSVGSTNVGNYDNPNSVGSTNVGNYDNPNSVGSTNVGHYDNPNSVAGTMGANYDNAHGNVNTNGGIYDNNMLTANNLTTVNSGANENNVIGSDTANKEMSPNAPSEYANNIVEPVGGSNYEANLNGLWEETYPVETNPRYSQLFY